MAEGRETDAVAERPVELAYRPTVGELASALRARARSTGAGRFQRRVLVWTVAVTIVGALLSAAGSGRHGTPWQLYAGVVVFAAFMTAVPWLQARHLHRLAERQGDICGTVDDTGVRLATAHSSASLDWHLYPRYVETPDLFVLLSADKSAVGFVERDNRHGRLLVGEVDPALRRALRHRLSMTRRRCRFQRDRRHREVGPEHDHEFVRDRRTRAPLAADITLTTVQAMLASM